MCGIVGYVGEQESTRVLIDALKKLEYRGYDSAGVAVVNADPPSITLTRSKGYISNLEGSIEESGNGAGISHTRWATHGIPSEENAHPHMDGSDSIAVVHNGIIDNHLSLKEGLIEKGHQFLSQTDSEVIPHLLEGEYGSNGGDLFEALKTVCRKLEGSYAIVAVHRDHPDIIVSAREKSPMVLGKGVHESFVASDVTALLKYTNRFLYMEDGEVAKLDRENIHLETLGGEKVERDWVRVDWSVEDAEKGGFEHYMKKEIHEQPRALHQSLSGWRSDEETLPRSLVQTRMSRIIACGTSYHAGMVGQYLMEKFTGVPTTSSMASEYRFSDSTSEDSLMLFITQSGETLDTIMAAREATRKGLTTVSITNVVGSTITRETDLTLYLRSGPEIGVAASKTFTSQLMMMYLLSSHLGYNMGGISREDHKGVQKGLRNAIRSVEKILSSPNGINEQAEWFSEFDNAFYLGRYINYPTALEGALKMKEISYIHCEGYPAGELKHGPLALLTDRTPVVAILANDHTYDKMLGNIGECSARGAPVLAIVPEGDTEVKKYTDRIITYPDPGALYSPIPISVTLQLLAYHTAYLRGCSIDKPRNLAKSVTVE